MPTLTEPQIAAILAPYLPASPEILPKLSLYLDLLLKWNARTNLTAIREPEEIVRRHFGESLFAAQYLGLCPTLLDFGSGAGFPGLPIAILKPEIAVTLAESQNKKATFLREVIRTLQLPNAEVWGSRVETMPDPRSFHTVTLRAVDNMAAAIAAACPRASHELLLLTSTHPAMLPEFTPEPPIPIPESQSTILLRAIRNS
jgi:16S rRNA (guanine527-N7)-methyltransferase